MSRTVEVALLLKSLGFPWCRDWTMDPLWSNIPQRRLNYRRRLGSVHIDKGPGWKSEKQRPNRSFSSLPLAAFFANRFKKTLLVNHQDKTNIRLLLVNPSLKDLEFVTGRKILANFATNFFPDTFFSQSNWDLLESKIPSGTNKKPTSKTPHPPWHWANHQHHQVPGTGIDLSPLRRGSSSWGGKSCFLFCWNNKQSMTVSGSI